MNTKISTSLSLFGSIVFTLFSQFAFQILGYTTINFQTNGGSPINPIKQVVGTSLVLPQSEKVGYSFMSWFTDQTLTRQFNETLMPKNNLTIYAKWTINQYTISFNSNGGTSIQTQINNYNTSLSIPTPTKVGHSFAGWFTDVGLTQAFTLTNMPPQNLTLFAKWTINQYTITFNTNGGSSISPITGNYGDPVTTPEDPTREGYTFSGWYVDANLTQSTSIPTTIPSQNLTLYAKWTINQYTITFNTNGGNSLEPLTGYYGQIIPDFPIPIRDNYVFNTWFEDIQLTKPYTRLETFPSRNLVLFASWISGSGNLETPYLLSNVHDLEMIRSHPNAMFELTNNISVPSDFKTIPNFNGSFNGANNQLLIKNPIFQQINANATLRDLKILVDFEDSVSILFSNIYHGFFATINQGVIDNIVVTFKSSSISVDHLELTRSNIYYFGFIGRNQGIITNVTLSGNSLIRLTQNFEGFVFGPLVGHNSGNLDNIQNLNVNIESESIDIGGVVGYSDGTLSNIVNRGEITNNVMFYTDEWTSNTGGIASGINGSSNNLSNFGNIVVSSTSDFVNIGGIAGYIFSETQLIISDAYNFGTLKGNNSNNSHDNYLITNIGGVTSFLSPNVQLRRATNLGDITNMDTSINFNSLIGGLVGRNEGTIFQSYNMGNIFVADKGYSEIGGVVGRNYGVITQTFNKGNISSMNSSSSSYVGGISGSLAGGYIENSYHRGLMSLSNQSIDYGSIAGGIVGIIHENSNTATIQNVYSSSDMEGESYNWYGGIIGRLVDTPYFVNNVHYYRDSLITDGIATNQLSIGSSYSSISNMYNLANTLGLNLWENVPNGLPILKWEINP